LDGTYHVSPQTIAESVIERIERGERFTACVVGPRGSGKTTVLAAIAQASRNQIAGFAPWPAVTRLQSLTGKEWQLPLDAMRKYTAVIGSNKYVHADAVASGYIEDVLARINDISDPPTETEELFLESLKPRVLEALRADHDARLDRQPLPRNAYLEAVREYAAAYRKRRGLLDKADLIHSNYYVCRQVRLLLMDEVEAQDAAVLPRYFPNASIVTTSRQQKDGHVSFHLPACLRQPVSIELEAQFVSMVPPPEDFASLFVLACPWHRSAWLAWLKHHGLPAPFRLSKWSADHAAAVLARFNRLSQLPTVRLGSPASVQGIEAEFVIVERAACFNADLLDIALTRATRQTIVINAAGSRQRSS